jgi:hypothetical protein
MGPVERGDRRHAGRGLHHAPDELQVLRDGLVTAVECRERLGQPEACEPPVGIEHERLPQLLCCGIEAMQVGVPVETREARPLRASGQSPHGTAAVSGAGQHNPHGSVGTVCGLPAGGV